ncbi:PTP type protein phosphatase [Trinorchestia longiramus]|nr:PTP type protein phosphatase [Trinorchestia longiramus]
MLSVQLSEPGSAPRSVHVRPISSSTMVIQWQEPEAPNGQITSYKVYYTNNDSLPIAAWKSQTVQENKLTTISELIPHSIYTICVQAVTGMGPGPLSNPVKVKTQQGVPSQPSDLKPSSVTATSIAVSWTRPSHQGENIINYELYWSLQKKYEQRTIPDGESYVLQDLTPNTVYSVWLAAKSQRGEGAETDKISVRTEQSTPGAPPQNIQAFSETSESIRVVWEPPPPELQHGDITSYTLMYVNSSLSDDEAHQIKISDPNEREYVISGLQKWTEYRVWMTAGTSVGAGIKSDPIMVRTDEDVPGEPRGVDVKVLNSTSIEVKWGAPSERERHGIIRGYQIHVQAVTSRGSEVIPQGQGRPYTTHKGDATSYIITDLEPDTQYQIQVAALTRKGDGARSNPERVTTPGGVPNKPFITVNGTVDKFSGKLSVYVEWVPPTQPYGEVQGYRLRYGPVVEPMLLSLIGSLSNSLAFSCARVALTVQLLATQRAVAAVRSHPSFNPSLLPSAHAADASRYVLYNTVCVCAIVGNECYVPGLLSLLVENVFAFSACEPFQTVTLQGSTMLHRTLDELQRGVQYEIRVSAKNRLDYGEEAVRLYSTPEAAPSGPPTNISYRYQTPGTIVFTWDPPAPSERNGLITKYDVQFKKDVSLNNDYNYAGNTTFNKKVFDGLDENMRYVFKVRASTSKGPGPFSQDLVLTTHQDLVRAPVNLQGMATSESSIEIWWEPVPSHGKLIGYKVFYSMAPTPDMEEWQQLQTAVTHSAELQNLEQHAEYGIKVAARTPQGLGRLSKMLRVNVKPVDVPLRLRAHHVTTHSANLTWNPPIRLNPQHYKITYSAYKEFVDARGVTQVHEFKTVPKVVGPRQYSFVIEDLRPFTTYTVNVTAVPSSNDYRPPARITVTTQMAAPQPMVKPDFYGVKGPHEIAMILPQASEEYGPIAHYFLVVVPEEPSTPTSKFTFKQPDQYMTDDLMANKAGSKEALAEGPYIAAKFMHRSIPYSFSLGDGKIKGGFKNRPLQKDKKYKIFVRAVVDTPGRHLYTSSPFSTLISLDMRPAPTGELPSRPNPFQPNHSSDLSVPRSPSHPQTLMIVGPLVGAVVLVVICLFCFLFFWKRRRQPKIPDQSQVTKPLMADLGGMGVGASVVAGSGPASAHGTLNSAKGASVSAGAPGLISNGPSDPVELRRLNYQTPAMMSHPPIPVQQLAEHIELLKANDNQKFSQEYESIDPGQQFTWDNSNLDVNKPKNRRVHVAASSGALLFLCILAFASLKYQYANVIAYDHSRVTLQPLDGVLGSDYINANFCDGYRKPNAYIATQGPLPETFGDFWRMCWEQGSTTLVMMTKLEERTRIKCDQYWPGRVSQTEAYNNMHVTLTDVQELATYTVRTFQLQKMGGPERREIRQFQFTAWPDHGVPDTPTPFLTFLRRVKQCNPVDSGPIVVHCSAGVGRTGAFIVIDAMLERIKTERTVDIYGHVTCLRAQRNYMVQTEDQYMFIHDALLEAIVAGSSEVAARALHAHIQRLLQPTDDNVTGMEAEFKRLANIKAQPSRFVSANLAVNKFKNRLVNILPYESTRVCLQPLRGTEGADYINASFIDGYRYRCAYIATQGPLQETLDDFWRMLWEHNSTIVVMLTKLKELGREKCCQYWPSERSQRYQFFVVDPLTEYNMPQYILREFKVTDARDGQSRTIRQFQFIEWPEQGVPKTGEGFIDFIGQVHKTKEQFGQDGPITVHCSAGVGRTGVFITLSQVLERMQYEGLVDLFQTVRMLRTQRPAMVQTEEEYRFCYLAALEYLDSFDHFVD